MNAIIRQLKYLALPISLSLQKDNLTTPLNRKKNFPILIPRTAMFFSKKLFTLFIIFIAITGFTSSFCQSNAPQKKIADVFIKNGKSFHNVEIKEFLPWGFTIDSAQTIIYKVISKITTADRCVVDEILKDVDSIKVDLTDKTYTLDFGNARIKYKSTSTPNGASEILYEKSACFSLSTNKYENFGISVYFFPKFLPDCIYLNLNASGNFFTPMANGYSKDIYVRGAYGAIGYAFKYKTVDLLGGFGFGARVIQYTVASTLEEIKNDNSHLQTTYAEIAFRFHIIPHNVFVIIGFRDYLTNKMIGGEEKNIALKFGLGFNF